MLKVINLYGGPGTGKSTTAAGLFFRMKSIGMNVELVTEFAKDLTYRKSTHVLRDQGYVLAEQHHRLWQCRDQVDFVVTDSPLLLPIVYADLGDSIYHTIEFRNYVLSLMSSYNNINVFLKRSSNQTYSIIGRQQTQDQAHEIDQKIIDLLNELHIDWLTVGVDSAVDDIFEMLTRGKL